MLPQVEQHDGRHGHQLGDPLGRVGQAGAPEVPQAVDNQHGDDGRRQHLAQVQHHLGGLSAPVKEQKGQRPGQQSDQGHDGDGGRGVKGMVHWGATSASSPALSSSRLRRISRESTMRPRAGMSICSAPMRMRQTRVQPAPRKAGRCCR